VIYEPLDLLAKLAALIPRPHKNLVLYHGVLSANAAWRSRVVAYGRSQSMPDAAAHTSTNCGGKMELLAVIFERTAIRKILNHLGLPSEPPAISRARASPEPHLPFDHVA
jgi:hypothetical protein